MLSRWKNEQGMTLLELLIAVVVLTIVVIPLTSLGTTVYRWFREDQLQDQAVLLAEQMVQEQRVELEASGYPFVDDPHVIVLDPNEAGLQATVTLKRHQFGDLNLPETNSLLDIAVDISGPNLEKEKGSIRVLAHLETTIRQKATEVTP